VRLFFENEAATLAFGRALAQTLPETENIPFVLLRGPLGSGKTTLVRGFVSALPGAENAEVASPSFNLANVYPTGPTVVHADLYRLGLGATVTALEELLEAGPDCGLRVTFVEWAEYLPKDALPAQRLEIALGVADIGRTAHAAAQGPLAKAWLDRTRKTSSLSFAL